MLTKIALDPEALLELFEPPSLMKSVHQVVIDTLNAHGRIVFRSDKEAKRFIEATKSSSLSPNLVKRWEAVIYHLYKTKRARVLQPQDEVSISALSKLAEIEGAWSGKVSVMVLSSDAAAAVGVPSDEGVLDDSDADLELATLHSATLTKSVSNLRALAASIVFPFKSRNVFWGEVLGPIAEVSQSVSILDKYIFKEVWYRADKPWKITKEPPEQLVWLLRNLDDEMRGGSKVHILSHSSSSDPGLEETADAIRNAWKAPSAGRLSKVEISLSPVSKGFPHDRHIRFNTGVGIALSAGFDRLQKPECWDPSGMSWSYIYMPNDVEALRQREARALELDASTATVLER